MKKPQAYTHTLRIFSECPTQAQANRRRVCRLINVLLSIWTEPAAAALESIQDHIAKDNPRAAWDVALKIRDATSLLSEHPKLGRTGRVRGTYELVIVGLPYVVPYRVKDKQIQILTVYHASRKWPVEFS